VTHRPFYGRPMDLCSLPIGKNTHSGTITGAAKSNFVRALRGISSRHYNLTWGKF